MSQQLEDLFRLRKIYLGTNNKKKIVELLQLLEPRGFQLLSPSHFPDPFDVDEVGTTFMENAELKASSQARHRGLWTIGEDSGLCVPALQGEPGIFSARFSGPGATDAKNNSLLLERMQAVPKENRQAYYVSTIALSDPDGHIHLRAYGECWGQILFAPRGDSGFGYDPLFEVTEYHQTFAELGLSVKRAISHRARALREFLLKLDLVTNSAATNRDVASG